MKRILALTFLLTALAPVVSADPLQVSFLLQYDGCTGSCGTPPFGLVTLTMAAPGSVDVSVDLSPDSMTFVNTGLKASFAFNLEGNPQIGVPQLSDGWTWAGPGAYQMSAFGFFDYALTWELQGGGNGTLGPLAFTVTAPNLTIDSFRDYSWDQDPTKRNSHPSPTPYLFAADIMGSTGLTGAVAGGCEVGDTCTQVPEPATLLLFGTGLLGSGFLARRRKK